MMPNSENRTLKQSNLAAGMFVNTAQFWSGIFWATANMNWRTARRRLLLTSQLLDKSYQVAVENLAGTTLVLAKGSIDVWKDTLHTLNASIGQGRQAFDQKVAPRPIEGVSGQRRTQIFEPNSPAQGRARIVEPDKPAQGRTRVYPQGSSAQGRAHVFHQEERLPNVEASFYFRGPEGQHNLPVDDLQHFVQLAPQVDDETWQYHLKRGDYSHWFRTSVQDEELAAASMRIEKQDLSPQDSRERLLNAIRQRYTIAA